MPKWIFQKISGDQQGVSLVVPGSYFVSLFVREVGAGGDPRDPVYNKSKVNPRLWLFDCPKKEHYVMKLLCKSKKKNFALSYLT